MSHRLVIPPLSTLKNPDEVSVKTRLLCEPNINSSSSSTSSSSSYSSCFDESPNESQRFENIVRCKSCPTNLVDGFGYKSLAVLSDHVGSVSCIALCGKFVLSASQGKDVIVWQQPDLKQFTRVGEVDGSGKALVGVGNKVFTAYQDSRVWKVLIREILESVRFSDETTHRDDTGRVRNVLQMDTNEKIG